MPLPAAEHDSPGGGAHVADPPGLAGEGHQVVAAVTGDPDEGRTADQPDLRPGTSKVIT